jgi:5-amino-6-(5-phosphoribosylamino)uracil reductase
VRILDAENCPAAEELVAGHVALPDDRPTDRAFVRLNMIASADGASEWRDCRAGSATASTMRCSARCDHADAVLVGIGTVSAEQYGPPAQPHLQIYVVTTRPETANDAALRFRSGDARAAGGRRRRARGRPRTPCRQGHGGPARPDDRAGRAGDHRRGGPTLAGSLASLGLIDQFFLTVASRVVAGDAGRVVHGASATPAEWLLEHGFVDDEGFLFLRYAALTDAAHLVSRAPVASDATAVWGMPSGSNVALTGQLLELFVGEVEVSRGDVVAQLLDRLAPGWPTLGLAISQAARPGPGSRRDAMRCGAASG